MYINVSYFSCYRRERDWVFFTLLNHLVENMWIWFSYHTDKHVILLTSRDGTCKTVTWRWRNVNFRTLCGKIYYVIEFSAMLADNDIAKSVTLWLYFFFNQNMVGECDMAKFIALYCEKIPRWFHMTRERTIFISVLLEK